ncbi:glycosyltransferase family 4 protein [Aliarcobacter thereius]|uniref:Glycosyltransferase family 4 protein n=1 Tax=Aliarcobacter thereius TaxID=544718 RepID=A0A5R9H3S2_9BACT|nr:glycosyltransferase family 4 protein [Aliarcobacter thereius]TLS71842.1 glycosyltransferase family 4 protein [Aliarcobacter thereius]
MEEKDLQNKKDLYLFFPMKEVGGVQILFLRLSEYLAKMNLFNIYLIDYKDGYMANNYDKNNIYLVEYNHKNNIYFKDNDIVLFQSMPLSSMPLNLVFSPKTKILFWNLHPLNFGSFSQNINNKILSNIINYILRKTFYKNELNTIKLFNQNHAICFMDGANINSIYNIFKYKIEFPLLIPLLIQNIKKVKFIQENSESINALWIGRICDFKVHILIYTIKELSKIKPNSNFTIIGDGDYLNYLKNELSKIKNINIIYRKYISPNDLEKEIVNYNIGFSMGTSALDMAKHGLPTICLDAFYEKIDGYYKFKWLFERNDFTLGEILNNNSLSKNIEDNNLKQIIGLCIDSFDEFSNKSFEYVNKNFNVDNSIESIKEFIYKSTLYYKNIPKKYFEFNLIQKIKKTKKAYGEYNNE